MSFNILTLWQLEYVSMLIKEINVKILSFKFYYYIKVTIDTERQFFIHLLLMLNYKKILPETKDEQSLDDLRKFKITIST